MSRYFFDLRYGADKLVIDPEGDEIHDSDSVREHALGIARNMLKTPSHAVRDWMTCAFEVRDHEQQLVCIVPFADVVAAHSEF